MEIIDTNSGVPSGWYYTFPETGFHVTAANYNALVGKCMRHCEVNHLPIDDLPARIQNYICGNNPPEFCQEPGLPKVGRMVVEGLAAFARNAGVILRGEELTTEDEVAQVRMEICKQCPHFRPHDERCSKCGCWLKSKAALAIEHCPINKW